MSTLTFESTRFGTVEIDEEAVIEFPAGLIGLGGARYALIAADPEAPFAWLHSVEEPDVALPVTDPWRHFGDYAVELSDADTDADRRVGRRRSGRVGHRSGRFRALGLQLQPPRADRDLERLRPPGHQRGAGRSRPRSVVPRVRAARRPAATRRSRRRAFQGGSTRAHHHPQAGREDHAG